MKEPCLALNFSNLLCCIYSNKDKNFKANHNDARTGNSILHVVSIVTKIRILKQITTEKWARPQTRSCIYSNKDKNFKANHNTSPSSPSQAVVVSIVTKIRILKQITTVLLLVGSDERCIYSNKDKNFKANHN